MSSTGENIVQYQRNITKPLPAEQGPEYQAITGKLENASAFILPEYFGFYNTLVSVKDFLDASEQAMNWLRQLSKTRQARGTLIFGGSLWTNHKGIVPENNDHALYNTCPVFFEGELITFYRKRKLFGHEPEILTAADVPVTVKHPVDGKNWGVLICADVKLEEAWQFNARTDYIAIPTSSPYLPDDNIKEQKKRDKEIYLNASKETGAILFKACSVGQVGADRPDGSPAPRLQGRSLVVTPAAIAATAPDINWVGFHTYNTSEQKTVTEELTINQ